MGCDKKTDTSANNLTNVSAPTLSTVALSNVSINSAVTGGTISSDGGASITQKGVVWSTTSGPTVDLSTLTKDGTGKDNFTSTITGLTASTKYFVRAYAINSGGVGYGSELSFTTTASATVPSVVETKTISGIGTTNASSGGNVTSDGGAALTAKGVCWSTAQNPTIAASKTNDGTGLGSFTSSITGLNSGTQYYVRAYATNSVGTAYGPQVSFSTTGSPASLPTLGTTVAATNVTYSGATTGGSVTSDGGAAVTARGVCWSISANPVLGANNFTQDQTGTGSFTSTITGLSDNTTYFVRSYATNSAGTSYGSQISFTTPSQPLSTPGNGVKDYDGNNYTTVIINGKEWMAANLKVTRYQNGETIYSGTGSNTSPKVVAYNGTTAAVYGLLYNGYAVQDSRNICPAGWYVPSLAEWKNMLNYVQLKTGKNAAGQLKSTSSVWNSPNTGATNAVGFNALPGGYRAKTTTNCSQGDGFYTTADLGNTGGFYSNDLGGIDLLFNSDNATIYDVNTIYNCSYLSVRCVKQ